MGVKRPPVPGPTGLMYVGAIAVDRDGWAWLLWSFDARESEPPYWWPMVPAVIQGANYRFEARAADLVPGTVVYSGPPEGYDW